MRHITYPALALMFAVSFSSLISLPAHAQGLPKGVGSLKENYGDWTVICERKKDAAAPGVVCNIQQVQMKKGTNQTVLVFSVDPATDGSAKGTLIVPFGLNFANGVNLTQNDKPLTNMLNVKTCMPRGCFVPLDFTAANVKSLRAGSALKVAAVSVDGNPVILNVTLKSFGEAVDRVIAIKNAK